MELYKIGDDKIKIVVNNNEIKQAFTSEHSYIEFREKILEMIAKNKYYEGDNNDAT